MKRRVLGVFLAVVVLVLTMIMPVGAVDPPDVTATVTMPNGTVHVIDTVFDINVYQTPDGIALDIYTMYGAEVDGLAGFGFVVVRPTGGGPDICIPGEFGC